MITVAAWFVPAAAMLIAFAGLVMNRLGAACWAAAVSLSTASPVIALLHKDPVMAAVAAVLALAMAGFALIERSVARRDRAGGAR